MELCTSTVLGPGHIVSDGDPTPPPPKGHSPHFSAHIRCGQMAAWIKMSLGMELGLGPGDYVLDGDPAHLPQKGRSPQMFGPCLFWPNGWMDQDGTSHGRRPQPRRLCVRWRPSLPPPKGGGAPSPIFGPLLLWPNGWMHQYANWYGCRPPPRRLCVRWGPSPRKFSSHVYYSYYDLVIECSSSSSSTLCILFLEKKVQSYSVCSNRPINTEANGS